MSTGIQTIEENCIYILIGDADYYKVENVNNRLQFRNSRTNAVRLDVTPNDIQEKLELLNG